MQLTIKRLIAGKCMVIASALLTPNLVKGQTKPLMVTQRHELKPSGRNFYGALSLAVSPDGKTLAYPDGGVDLWDLKTGRSRGRISIRKGERLISKLAFRADGKLITDGPPGMLRVWDPVSGRLIDEWKDIAKGAEQIVINSAGHLLAIACSDITGAGRPGCIRLVDAQTGKVRKELRGHQAMVTSVAFSADGKKVVSGSQDMTAAVWNIRTGRTQAVFRGHVNVINAVAISPDGKTVATGSHDQTVKLWDVPRRKARTTLSGHVAAITTMAFSPDGKFLVSGCTGGFPGKAPNVIFWDTSSGQKRAEFGLAGGRITAIAFPHNGTLATATGLGSRGAVRSWDVKTR